MNNLLSLDELFSKKIFRIPDYQRGYSWGRQQLEEFWIDILNILPEEKYYTGMISLKQLNDDETKLWNDVNWIIDKWKYVPYHVVDGQQRLTTIIILINEIVSLFEKNNKEFLNSIPLYDIKKQYLKVVRPDSEESMTTYIFGYEVNKPSDDYFKYKILEDENGGDIRESFYTLNLSEAKLFFKERVNELVESYGLERLEQLFITLTTQLKFNMYYVDADFNVFLAFETMNNRGKRLSNLELLKNRLIYISTLLKCEEDIKKEVRKNIDETWKTIYSCLGRNKLLPLDDDDFLQAHWIIYFGYSRSESDAYSKFLLKEFFTQNNIKGLLTFDTEVQPNSLEEQEDYIIQEKSEVVSNKKQQITVGALNKYVNSLKSIVPYWYDLHFPSEEMDSEISVYLKRLKRLGFGYFRPLIAVILYKQIPNSQKIEALRLIERFIFFHFRMQNYQSTYASSVFHNFAHNLYMNNCHIEECIEKLKKIDYFNDNNVINMNAVSTSTDRLFKKEGFYSWKSLRYLLFEYESYLMMGKGSKKIIPDDFFKSDPKDCVSIEHIYPQHPEDKYWTDRFNKYTEEQRRHLTGSLGNLLPLSKRINSKMQNYDFNIKKYGKESDNERQSRRGYVNGSFNEIEVSQSEEWIPEKILERGLNIVDFMQREWNFKFPSKADKIKFLGLDFMITEEDYYKNREE